MEIESILEHASASHRCSGMAAMAATPSSMAAMTERPSSMGKTSFSMAARSSRKSAGLRTALPTNIESGSGNIAKLQADQDIIRKESQLCVQTYARSPVVFVSGEGCKLYDIDKEYLDMTAGIAVNALGHGDPTWVKAVTEQAGKLAHVSNLYHTVPQVKLCERLVSSSLADRLFMVNSGTEANEAAIKFARKYDHALAKKNRGDALEATELAALTNGFRRRMLGALSLTSEVQYRTPFEPLEPGAHFVTFGDLEATRQVVVAGRTAAVFVEPLQNGGVCSATASFLKGLGELCDETETRLVFDEVQYGLMSESRDVLAIDAKRDLSSILRYLQSSIMVLSRDIGVRQAAKDILYYLQRAKEMVMSMDPELRWPSCNVKGWTIANGPRVAKAILCHLQNVKDMVMSVGIAGGPEVVTNILSNLKSTSNVVLTTVLFAVATPVVGAIAPEAATSEQGMPEAGKFEKSSNFAFGLIACIGVLFTVIGALISIKWRKRQPTNTAISASGGETLNSAGRVVQTYTVQTLRIVEVCIERYRMAQNAD